ncbi:MAG: SUMF1/EgtB/PvdO family nonheme iron enzyme [Blastocatellia bacterium]|nr:SUMF1/EgtB/PvdO family nonheme iron enzyme [Blastocatellia bacterium]
MKTRATPVSLTALLALFLILPISFPSSSQTQARNQGRELKVVNRLPDRSKRYALVVGVDEYRDKQINRLYGAAKDARMLSESLVRYAGFPADQVTLLATGEPEEREPTRANILQRLINLNGIVPKDGLLLVSFAGHGMQRGERAFLLPSDVRIGSLSILENTSVSVSQMKNLIRQTGAKQVLVILDACRNDPGGRADGINPMSSAYRFDFDTRNQEVEAFATLYATEVGARAYEYTEKEQGYFTWYLVEGLKGEAANAEGEVTLSGIVRYLQDKVPKRVLLDLGQEKKQRPWAYIEGYRADELVISITIRVPVVVSPPGADAATVELSFWDSIKSSADIEDFREYLKQYPNGRFAGLARNRVRQLEATAKPVSTATDPPATNPAGGQPTSPGANRQEHVEVETYTETAGGVGIEMVRVPAGRFTMGSPETEADRQTDEGPRHEVTISQSFYMGKYEVTQLQWRAVATKLPKVKIDLPSDPSSFKGGDLPVERVSWEEAIEFCDRLSRATGKRYRLPTEAEWEYACRAGTTTPFAFGETITPDLVNYDGNYPYGSAAKGVYRQKTIAVGSLGRGNRFGLYDMHGNVWEWCIDWYSENYYSQSPSADPTGPSTGSNRVSRGGSWFDNARFCRSADRGRFAPGSHYYLGFRLVRTLR